MKGRRVRALLSQLLELNNPLASQHNVEHHYDLDADLYRRFLDEELFYSCAYFERDDMTLEAAQQAKCALIARKLDLKPGARVLDWEDLDVLRIAGRQAASYLAESQSQAALSEAQRFDEFNRRFAFIMHDIKNLASQLSLLARNAERHADKPEFRADMTQTLKISAGRLSDLLVRLSPREREPAAEPGRTLVEPVLNAVAAEMRSDGHTSELPSLMSSSYAVCCFKEKTHN